MLAAMAALILPASARGVDKVGIAGFGPITRVVAVCEEGWLLGGGVAVADAKGDTLRLCIGFRPGEEHRGFRVGALHPNDEGAKTVAIGSQEESALLKLLQDYLDRKYSFTQQRQMSCGGDLAARAGSGKFDAYLAGLLSGYHQLARMSRWLHDRYSPGELDSLAHRQFDELTDDADREAVGWLKALRLGQWVQDDELLRTSYLDDYQLKECGREPLTVVSIGWYYDGGTVGAVLTDADGCLVKFCIDHGLSTLTPGALYVGDRWPSSPNARIATAAEEERVRQLVEQVLKATCGRGFPHELEQAIAQRHENATGTKLIQELLKLLEGC